MAVTARKYFSARQPALLEKDFFAAIVTPEGVTKATQPHRMDDVNQAFGAWLPPADGRRLQILDVGVSSGVSTAEWRDSVHGMGRSCDFVGADLLIDASLVRLTLGYFVLVDKGGRVLQHDFAGLAVRPYYSRMPVHDAVTWLSNAVCGAIVKARGGMPEGEPLKLISRDAQGIDFREDDLFGAPPEFVGRFDAIRVSNVLNINYFSATRLTEGVVSLRRRLRGPGSLLIVNRTHQDGSNHGTLFQLKPGDAFEIHSRIGTGSEIENLVLAA